MEKKNGGSEVAVTLSPLQPPQPQAATATSRNSHKPQQLKQKSWDHARYTPLLRDLRCEGNALQPTSNMLALPGSVVLRRKVPETALEGAQGGVSQGKA